MGKFDGILIATDLDGTLLPDNKIISEKDKAAIEYFMAEGGHFTYSSGRSIYGLRPVISQLMPNAPVIAYNGTVVFNPETEEILWESFLDDEAIEAVDFIEKTYPFSGIEVCTADDFYVSRSNPRVVEQMAFEQVEPINTHHSLAPRPWRKVLFIQEADEIDAVSEALTASKFAERYNLMKSAAYYFELLPKDCSKGLALLKVAELLGIAPEKTIGVGDNDNDLALVELAGVGIAVANASDPLKAIADYVTIDNNSSAIAQIIEDIENKKLTI